MAHLLFSLPTLDWPEMLLRLALAGALGSVLGFERELREREAGLRTHLLVAVGSALFTIVSAYGFESFLSSGANVVRADPTRIAAQIVTGIGFLGAGAIIRQGVSIRGLTTAATLWVVAAIGMAAGAGYYSAAIITTAVALIALWPLRAIAFRMVRRFRGESGVLLVQLPLGESPAPLIETIDREARVEGIGFGYEGGRRTLELEIALQVGQRPADLVARLAQDEHVLEARWAE